MRVRSFITESVHRVYDFTSHLALTVNPRSAPASLLSPVLYVVRCKYVINCATKFDALLNACYKAGTAALARPLLPHPRRVVSLPPSPPPTPFPL